MFVPGGQAAITYFTKMQKAISRSELLKVMVADKTKSLHKNINHIQLFY